MIGWRVNPPEEFADFNEPFYLTGNPKQDKKLIKNLEWNTQGLLEEAITNNKPPLLKSLGKYFK